MNAQILGNHYMVFINNKLYVSGKFISRWAAFLAAVDIYGMDRIAGCVKIGVMK